MYVLYSGSTGVLLLLCMYCIVEVLEYYYCVCTVEHTCLLTIHEYPALLCIVIPPTSDL